MSEDFIADYLVSENALPLLFVDAYSVLFSRSARPQALRDEADGATQERCDSAADTFRSISKGLRKRGSD